VLVQTLASTLVHIGKPTGELYGAVAGGIVWGIVTFRARSIWPALLLHWLLGISLDYFILRP
jgi:membrane protease YdiL (CAAX protease family)